MNRSIESLISRLDGIKDPVTRGTLKITTHTIYDSVKSSEENRRNLFGFLDNLSSFYIEESKNHLEPYEIRAKLKALVSTLGSRDPSSVKASFRAMANSVADSMNDSYENHNAISGFLEKLSHLYWSEGSKRRAMGTVQYRDMNSWDKFKIFKMYQKAKENNVSKWEFVKSNNLSSVYALNKIVKEYNSDQESPQGKVVGYIRSGEEDGYSMPISELINRRSLEAAANSVS